MDKLTKEEQISIDEFERIISKEHKDKRIVEVKSKTGSKYENTAYR